MSYFASPLNHERSDIVDLVKQKQGRRWMNL